MISKTLEKVVWKSSIRVFKVSFSPWIILSSSFKEKKVKLELLTDTESLLMVEKGIRGGICPSITRQVKANNKCKKDYNKNKELSYLKYWM